MFLLLALLPIFAQAEPLTNVEVRCWHESVDDGAFYCQYVTILGNRSSNDELVVASLAAPGQGGEKTQQHADRACAAMGFLYAVRYELDDAEGKGAQVTLTDSGAYISPNAPKILQHLSCE